MTGIARFSLPLAKPLATAQGTIDRRDGFLVRIGEDPAGIGEAAPLPGWTEPIDACRDALEAHVESIDRLDSAEELPAMGATPAARHGLELALLDRAARSTGSALYRFLGGDRRVSAIPVNAVVGDADVDDTVAACLRARGDGFRTIKVKAGGRAVGAEVDRLAAVREAVGPGLDLRVDANGAWDPDRGQSAVDQLGELGVSLVEQPLPPADLAGHAELRDGAVDIGLDESVRDHGIDGVLEARAADVVVLKPMVLGGVGRAGRIAERARRSGVDVVVTTTIDGVVARTAAVHLAAALQVDRACGLATAGQLANDVGSDPAPVVDGTISVPQGAGHGVGVEALE